MSCEINIRKLRKEYAGGTIAVDGVSLTCPRGRITSLVGPSGSGKSTVLKIIAGLLEPSEGRVLFDGNDVTELPSERRNIGMVFQSYALFPNMTAGENVEFGLLVRGVGATERRHKAQTALEIVQIPHLAGRSVHQLSGGEQQRVALARAVVFQPDILLLDEPLSALDAKIRLELRGELARLLSQFGITAVYVTHDQQEAMSLGDQVVVLDRGLVMQAGTSYEIYARPANPFVARFIGTANLYDVDVAGTGDAGVTVRLPFGEIAMPEGLFSQRWPRLQQRRAQLLCRPEDIEIVDAGREHARIEVRESLFLGDRVRITGRTASGEDIIVETHNSTPVRRGDILGVCFAIENIHFLAADT